MSHHNSPAPGKIRISVAYATAAHQTWREIDVPEGATVIDAVKASGLLEEFSEIDLETQKLGIFGKVVKGDQPVESGDRVEIYRQITADPKAVRRKRPDQTGNKAAEDSDSDAET